MAPAKTCYIGTTGRSQNARAIDHQKALRCSDKKNALAKHMLLEHSSAQPSFSLHKIGSHRFNLQRQILEGICIEAASENKSLKLLNSRSEWGRSKLFRLRVENSQGN